jgi:2-haloacid dehalogenase
LRRTAEKWSIEHRASDARTIYEAVPGWGPHPDVPEALAALASRYPLVILSNASDDQIQSNVEKLGAPFHAVYTAQQAQAYKPRFRAFEYMLDQLGVNPGDILHVSSSLRYDLMPAHDLRITNKVYVNRGYEPSTPHYGYHEVADLGGLPPLLGL